ncbi:LysR family transcriptional regulator [Altererythrobacter sp. Root672]|uniref:LysR family transcriptional regulator n=1 Tax=Altererythrobacter sp. Root672 TaxID=1736584 RepID=UPI00138ECE85
MDTLRLIWLEAFVEAVDRGSYSKAAKVLDCDPGGASRYVLSLGEWLGPQLTHSGTTCLTLAGERFIPVAREVVSLLREARNAHRSPKPSPAPVLAKDLKI